ncbi:MAG: ABC transporter ATP-binding protein [Lentilactobacillus hilgardii]|jgi:ABC-2 type transport system ATP-binding protein|uniref:ATP-binding cassette domain-containing protein n=1 Tax=Lentilactobacillus hilgardii TaxID=1588 RepID=A0A6P1EGW1_LENHI|nr:ABC transporter ATP-binding protein [Lentilactobacillus hilgardii]RRG11244.1 MAG: ABC transporter ATP-binding protein [Lactobacillus sp.]EEI72334.1 ABC transporter, ATP-binding protein [Lentilactobacillus hilgardii ATCC 27305]MBZ2201938.1 ABC transporter ATP-binding protein [Lentilactobacillus hilgardii]MBZ2204125.1 ABC transporter ATP-binding protein [Lentilactobacillus hilgardii]MCT3392349.1 ABC transporter ATP-binding protein [Lentilactobacillus hilgardii]
MAKVLLQINHLKTVLDSFTLRDISFTATAGDIIGIIGENGSGKTSLLKSIVGIYPLSDGNIHLDTDQIGFAFDSIPFPQKLTIKELSNVLKNLLPSWQSKTFDAYVDSFNLPRNTPLEKFSKGMKMQFSVAVTLSHKASLLLFDEITSGLDPIVRNTVLEAIKNYVITNHAAVIMTTHNLDDVIKIGTRFILLDNGKIILERSINYDDNATSLEQDFVQAVKDWGNQR